MYQKSKIICLILSLISSMAIKAQDIHFSDVQQMGQWYNQSLKTACVNDVRMNFRNIQYQNDMAFKTGSVLINMPVLNKTQMKEKGKNFFNLTGGLSFDQSSSNVSFKNTVGLLGFTYSQALNAKNLRLAAGFQGQYTSYNYGTDGVFPDQFDQFGPLSGTSNDPIRSGYQYHYMSLNAGLSLINSTDNTDWYLGTSVRHFNQPFTEQTKSSNYRLAPTWGVQAGLKLKSEYNKLDLFYLSNMKTGASEYVAGVGYDFILSKEDDGKKENFSVGAGCTFRLNDGIIPNLHLEYNKSNLAVFYDMNTSGIRSSSFTRKGFELALTQKF